MKNSFRPSLFAILVAVAFSPVSPVSAVDEPASAFAADFIAHEWGTFTSVQGADGVQFEWNPFVAPELPKFVYNVTNPTGHPIKAVVPGFSVFGKTGTAAFQRMETPVIYFYSAKNRSVDVDVQFMGGRITEWYPQLTNPKAQALYPQLTNPKAQALLPASGLAFMKNRARIRWTDVQLCPGSEEAKLYPFDATGSHYYAARETDAVPLRVKSPDGTEQHEKFLFYRGVAEFQAPLEVRQSGENAEMMTLANRTKQPLGSLFVYAVRGNRAAFVPLANLKGGETRSVEFNFDRLAGPLGEIRAQLAAKIRGALVSGGLYEKEAAAMVKTWDDSWFAEQGTRVLYTLPREWVDGVLPLTLTPSPKELSRVFVGRAEMITPMMDWAVLREIVRYADGDEAAKAAAVKAVQAIGLGRFTGPAIQRVAQVGPQANALRSAASALLNSIRPANPGSVAKAGSQKNHL